MITNKHHIIIIFIPVVWNLLLMLCPTYVKKPLASEAIGPNLYYLKFKVCIVGTNNYHASCAIQGRQLILNLQTDCYNRLPK